MEATDRRGRCRAIRTDRRRRRHPAALLAIAASAYATRAASAAARTPSWIAWRPISAGDRAAGVDDASPEVIESIGVGDEHCMTTQRFRHRRTRVGDRVPLGIRAHRRRWPMRSRRAHATPAPTSTRDRRRPDDRCRLGHARRGGRHRVRHRDLHGQRVGGLSGVRRADRASLHQRHLARQGGGGVHQLRRQERRQAEHPGVAGRVRGPAPHALGQPGFGPRLEQLDRQRGRPQPPGVLSGRGRTDRRRRRTPTQVHPSDVRTCRHLGRRVALVTRQLNVGRAASPAASNPAASSAPAH